MQCSQWSTRNWRQIMTHSTNRRLGCMPRVLKGTLYCERNHCENWRKIEGYSLMEAAKGLIRWHAGNIQWPEIKRSFNAISGQEDISDRRESTVAGNYEMGQESRALTQTGIFFFIQFKLLILVAFACFLSRHAFVLCPFVCNFLIV